VKVDLGDRTITGDEEQYPLCREVDDQKK